MRTDSVPIARKTNASAEALLVATAELLSERGDLDVSFAEISRRSGVNAAMIKYYFGNKDGLLLALVERDAERPMAAMDHLLTTALPADEKLRIHISGVINTYHRSPYLNRVTHHLLNNASPDAATRVIDIFMAPMVNAYRVIIAQGVDEGTLAETDPRFLYFTIVGACEHIFFANSTVRHVLGAAKVTDRLKQEFSAHVTEILLAGLRPRPIG